MPVGASTGIGVDQEKSRAGWSLEQVVYGDVRHLPTTIRDQMGADSIDDLPTPRFRESHVEMVMSDGEYQTVL